jgi:hypothetical protein
MDKESAQPFSEEDLFALEERLLSETCYVAGQGATRAVCARLILTADMAGVPRELRRKTQQRGQKVHSYFRRIVRQVAAKYPDGLYFYGERISPIELGQALIEDLDLEGTGREAPVRRATVTQIIRFRCSVETFRYRGKEEKCGAEADLLRIAVKEMIDSAQPAVITALCEKLRLRLAS